MSTSILDYIFRELAISYIGRNDLAHVDLGDIRSDTIGRGQGDSTRDNEEPELPHLFSQATSNGFVRGRLPQLIVTNGGTAGNLALAHEEDLHNKTKAYRGAEQTQAKLQSSTAKITQEEAQLREQILEARAKGYEGDPCGDCGNFTMVRNGTCMKCDTCGATSGCS